MPLILISNNFGVSKKAIWKVILTFVDKTGSDNFELHKLGDPGKIVQVDKTMMNYKCKRKGDVL